MSTNTATSKTAQIKNLRETKREQANIAQRERRAAKKAGISVEEYRAQQAAAADATRADVQEFNAQQAAAKPDLQLVRAMDTLDRMAQEPAPSKPRGFTPRVEAALDRAKANHPASASVEVKHVPTEDPGHFKRAADEHLAKAKSEGTPLVTPAKSKEKAKDKSKLANLEKKALRRAMYDAVKANVTAEMAKHPELEGFSADVLDKQVDAYLKYLLPEIVKEVAKETAAAQ